MLGMHGESKKIQFYIIVAISLSIGKYGSTFYIGIAMVVLPYFGPMRKLKFQFSHLVSTQFDFYQHQGGTHVES